MEKQSPKSTLNEKKSKIKVNFNLLKLLNKMKHKQKKILNLKF